MEYITSYLIVKNNILVKSRLWLRQLHIPYVFIDDKDVLIVFNLNRDYLVEFIRRYNPDDWQYDSAFDLYPDEYLEVFDNAARTLSTNLYQYLAYNRKDVTAGPFTNPLDDEKIFTKAFNGTGYNAWKTRWYLCRDGMCEGQFDDASTASVRAAYTEMLDEAIRNTQTDVKGLKIDTYFDYRTFYVGWFVDSDEELSYVGASSKLKPLNEEMNRLIAEGGLERNLSRQCGIPLYLRKMGLPDVDYVDNFSAVVNTIAGSCGLLGYDYTQKVCGDEEVNDWAVIRLKKSKLLRELQNIRGIPIIALDRDRNKIVLGNIADHILSVLALSSSMAYSRTTPPKEYSQLVSDIEQQMNYNKSLPFMVTLKKDYGRYDFDKLYGGMRCLNAAKPDRKVIEDYPNRVECLKYGIEDEVAAIIHKYLTNKHKCNIELTFKLLVNYNGLIKSVWACYGTPDNVVLPIEHEIGHEWVKIPSYDPVTDDKEKIVKFFRYLFDVITELHNYFRII